MLADFMDNMSGASWKREGRDEAKQNLLRYLLAMNYGATHFTETERITVFTQLDAIGMLWPGESKMRKLHVRWRDSYYDFWFKKWWKKNTRKLKQQ